MNLSGSMMVLGMGAVIGGCARSSASSTLTQPQIQCPGNTLLGPTVTPASATLSVGDTLRLVAKIDCTVGGAPASFTWASKESAIATVDTSSGLVTAIAKGTAVIVATWTADPTSSGASTITVTP